MRNPRTFLKIRRPKMVNFLGKILEFFVTPRPPSALGYRPSVLGPRSSALGSRFSVLRSRPLVLSLHLSVGIW